MCSSDEEIETATRLALAIRLLAGTSYLDLVVAYNIAPSTIYAIFNDTVRVINARLTMTALNLKDESALRSMADGFNNSENLSSLL